MKNLLAAIAVCCCAMASHAGPFQPNLVDADAKWVVHLDMDALLDSSLMQRGIDRWIEEENGQHVLNHIKRELGVDLREDVESITLYNTGYAEHEAVMIVNADFDQEKLLAIAKTLPDHEVVAVDSIDVHTWTDKEHGDRTVAGAFASDDVLVLGSSLELVEKALATLRGDGQSLEGEASPLVGDRSEGAVLHAAVVGLATADVPNKADMPAGLDAIAMEVGEKDDAVFLNGLIAAKNEDTAANIQEIIEGARALVMLSPDVEAEAKRHFRKATIEQSSDGVEFEMSLPAKLLWEVMEQAEARKKTGK